MLFFEFISDKLSEKLYFWQTCDMRLVSDLSKLHSRAQRAGSLANQKMLFLHLAVVQGESGPPPIIIII